MIAPQCTNECLCKDCIVALECHESAGSAEKTVHDLLNPVSSLPPPNQIGIVELLFYINGRRPIDWTACHPLQSHGLALGMR